jgi:hypothetical protein
MDGVPLILLGFRTSRVAAGGHTPADRSPERGAGHCQLTEFGEAALVQVPRPLR